jgi:hypothetical protein
MTTDAADRFVDLACLTYRNDESRTRRDEASALLAATPDLVHAIVHAAAAAGWPRAHGEAIIALLEQTQASARRP